MQPSRLKMQSLPNFVLWDASIYFSKGDLNGCRNLSKLFICSFLKGKNVNQFLQEKIPPALRTYILTFIP